MKLNLNAFVDAVRLHLTPPIASTIPSAAAALAGLAQPPEAITDDEAGELILRILRGDLHAPTATDLTIVNLIGPETLKLDPSDACAHPMLTGWIPQTLAEAFAAPIKAGARGWQFWPNAPRYSQVTSCEGQNVEAGWLQMAFRDGPTVHACYGPVNASLPFVTSRMATGDALVAVGRAARLGTMAPTPPNISGGGGGPTIDPARVVPGTGALN